MKTVTLAEMQTIAALHGGILIEDIYPSIEFENGDYGFEATEEMDGQYYGFSFFGHTSKQALPHIMKCWSDLTEENIIGDQLTIERANNLMNKKVTLSYRNSSGIPILLTIEIVGMNKKKSNQIGQKEEHELLFRMIKDDLNKDYVPDGKILDWIYEWMGIFRVTGSARILFIEKIFE